LKYSFDVSSASVNSSGRRCRTGRKSRQAGHSRRAGIGALRPTATPMRGSKNFPIMCLTLKKYQRHWGRAVGYEMASTDWVLCARVGPKCRLYHANAFDTFRYGHREPFVRTSSWKCVGSEQHFLDRLDGLCRPAPSQKLQRFRFERVRRFKEFLQLLCRPRWQPPDVLQVTLEGRTIRYYEYAIVSLLLALRSALVDGMKPQS
jgi:hypothetical protein